MSSFMDNTNVSYAPLSQHIKAETDDLEDGSSRSSSEGSRPRQYTRSLGSMLLSMILWMAVASLAILNVYQWRFSHDRHVKQDIYCKKPKFSLCGIKTSNVLSFSPSTIGRQIQECLDECWISQRHITIPRSPVKQNRQPLEGPLQL